jgi:deoxyuridine 5'-triphosphate nucleotidohydrolase
MSEMKDSEILVPSESVPEDNGIFIKETEEPAVKFSKDSDTIENPYFGSESAAGFDLPTKTSGKILPGDTVLVDTGLKFEVPEGSYLSVVPRSGLSLKTALWLRNSPGTIDSDYRNNIGLILANYGNPYKDIFLAMCAVFVAMVMYVEIDQYLLSVGTNIIVGDVVTINTDFFGTWPNQWLVSITVPLLFLWVVWSCIVNYRAFKFEAGDRLAQGIFLKHGEIRNFKEVEESELSQTKRGKSGYGSTGVKAA